MEKPSPQNWNQDFVFAMPVRAFKGGEGEVSAKAKDCANGGCNKAIEKRESEVVLRMNFLLVNVEV